MIAIGVLCAITSTLAGCGTADHLSTTRVSSYGPAISYSLSTNVKSQQVTVNHR